MYDLDGQRWGPWHFYFGGPLGISPRVKRSFHLTRTQTLYLAKHGMASFVSVWTANGVSLITSVASGIKRLPWLARKILLRGSFVLSMVIWAFDFFRDDIEVTADNAAGRKGMCMRITVYFAFPGVWAKPYQEEC